MERGEANAVVNSTNENLDEAHMGEGLYLAAGLGLVEECATLGGCKIGMIKLLMHMIFLLGESSIALVPSMQ